MCANMPILLKYVETCQMMCSYYSSIITELEPLVIMHNHFDKNHNHIITGGN